MKIADFDNGNYVIKAGATWCGPCKTYTPKFEKVSQEFEDVNFISIDVDECPEIAKKFQIRSLPTTVILNDGKEIDRLNGAVLIDALRSAVKKLSKAKQNAA